MRPDEIEQLRDEAAPQPAEPVADAPANDAPEADAPALEPAQPIPREQLAMMMAGVVKGVATPLCRRARVTALEPKECLDLGDAIAGLLSVYGFDRIGDPKVAAWFGLGVTAAGIIVARERLPDAPREKPVGDPPPPPANPPAPPASDRDVYGNGGAVQS